MASTTGAISSPPGQSTRASGKACIQPPWCRACSEVGTTITLQPPLSSTSAFSSGVIGKTLYTRRPPLGTSASIIRSTYTHGGNSPFLYRASSSWASSLSSCWRKPLTMKSSVDWWPWPKLRSSDHADASQTPSAPGTACRPVAAGTQASRRRISCLSFRETLTQPVSGPSPVSFLYCRRSPASASSSTRAPVARRSASCSECGEPAAPRAPRSSTARRRTSGSGSESSSVSSLATTSAILPVRPRASAAALRARPVRLRTHCAKVAAPTSPMRPSARAARKRTAAFSSSSSEASTLTPASPMASHFLMYFACKRTTSSARINLSPTLGCVGLSNRMRSKSAMAAWNFNKFHV
mmetsp:Transcript_72538/g.212592  ORF Transcript_72538/g.212592 Transcript_72538/m.212592 type:complete len:353 (+) Transcript_72538:626-1684(+)